jgi:ABC-type transport system involved in multi-copper enzyme maturation permease subunit
MNDVITIAQSTFYRIARMKSLYLILVICILDVAAMANYGVLSMGIEKQLSVDCALALMLVVGLVTAMSAAFEIPRELREKTAQYILSKPGGRGAFVWGKFFGVGMLAIFNIAILAAGSLLVYNLAYQEAPPWDMVDAAILVAGEAVMLTSAGVLLSIVLSDTLAAIGVFAVFTVGHSAPILTRQISNALGDALYYLLPNFYHLDMKMVVSHGVEIPPTFTALGVVYALAYAAAINAVAVIVFSRKDVS